MTITPIEESFALMNRYGLHYSSTDSEKVDGLNYAWKKLQDLVRAAKEGHICIFGYSMFCPFRVMSGPM